MAVKIFIATAALPSLAAFFARVIACFIVSGLVGRVIFIDKLNTTLIREHSKIP